MDTKALRTLKLLQEMEKIPSPSQRNLSKTLNISLGSVNSFMKRLVNEGYIEVASIPKKRFKYTLTPKGMAQKKRLSHEFIQYSLEFYKITREKLRHLFHDLIEQNVRHVALYGVGDFTEIAYIALKETPIRVVAVVDDVNTEKLFMGLPVINLSELSSVMFDKILVVDVHADENAFRRITACHVSPDKVIMLN